MTPPPPPTGRSVFRASDLSPEQWTTTLGEDEIDTIARAARPIAARGEAALTTLLEEGARAFDVPSLAPRLRALRDELLSGRGFAVWRGVPVSRYSRLELAAIFLGLGAHLGAPRKQNAQGDILGHVCDLGLSSRDPLVRLYQTHERQTFHTDSCDVVGLLCLRAAQEGGDSLLVSAGALYAELHRRSPALLSRLLAPMAHDRRGEIPPGQPPFFLLPVFSWFEGQLTVFYQRQYIESAQRFEAAPRLTAEDLAALDLLDAIADDPTFHLRMRLEPGDVQWVHNHGLLHDRTAFVDDPDPQRRRHLLRLWLACPGARPLPSAFAARYGSVTIGDRGGIDVAPPRVALHS